VTKGQLTELKIFTIEDIRSWNPCYDPKRYLSEGWRGTAIDILEHKEIPPRDKLWVVCREAILDAKTLRLFAVWCARQVEHHMTDERSKNALNVAERFAHGDATREELDEAIYAARDAADAAAYAAADAAYAAADAAYAARDAADAAAYAAYAARYAADAARDAQVSKLLEMLKKQEPKDKPNE